ncbi:MAG: tyrosine-type recombinase/integrase [Candidatus Aminicenantales bacterium]
MRSWKFNNTLPFDLLLLACRRAGIKGLRFHDLRLTFASRLVERGTDIITIKELLEHSSVKVTERFPNSQDWEKLSNLWTPQLKIH